LTVVLPSVLALVPALELGLEPVLGPGPVLEPGPHKTG
jgi:hypothetical protein